MEYIWINRKKTIDKQKHLFKVAKMLFFFLFILSVNVNAYTFAQMSDLSLKLKNSTIKEAFDEIEKNSDYIFILLDNDNMTKEIDRKVDIDVDAKSINEILALITNNTALEYDIYNKQVVVYNNKAKTSQPIEKAPAPKAITQQQERVVSGRVVGSDGMSIIGANIIVEGTSIGTVTDINGEFSLKVEEDAILKISYLGYITLTINTKGRNIFEITLQEDTQALDEVVVIGYGSVRKKDIAGSIETVSSADISKTAAASFQKSMQGKMAGVQITAASGIPGGSFSINIRGRGSINASTQPLYIIDGVLMNSGAQSTVVLSNSDVLAGLNPDDIESITVLKDGASASIYGAQAANGVVLITTKKGKVGTTSISVNATVGVQELIKKVPVLTGPQWAEFALLEYKNYDQYNNTNEYPKIRDLFTSFGWGEDGYSSAPTTDWYDEIYQQALVQNYQLSLSSGTEQTKFYFSAGYNDTEGIIKSSGFKRATGRLNVSHAIKPWLTFNTNNSFSSTNHDQVSTTGAANPSRTAMFLLPGVSPRDEDGNYIRDLPFGYYQYNIPQMLELNEYTGKTSNLLTVNDLTFHLTDDLEFKSSYSFDFTWLDEHQFADPRTRLGARVNGSITASAIDITNFQTEQVLTYNKVFNENNRMNVVAGFSFRDNKFHMIGGEANGVANPNLKLLSSAAIPIATSEQYSQWRMAGLFARVAYTLKDRYIFSGTLRRDGSSRFGAENLWGTFPSASFAWRAIEEDFFNDISWLSDLKLRVSYGVTGNSSIGNYVSHRLYSGGTSYIEQPGIYPSNIGNAQLTWEKKHSKNLGLTLGFFKNKIQANLDLYLDDTKDLLYNRRIPTTTGFTSIPSNMGGVRNKGVDFNLNTINVDTKDFGWETSFNISANKNYITELQDGLDELGDLKIGKSITASHVYKWAGVNSADGRPMYYDKDGYITYNPTPDDRYWVNGTDPTIYGGLDNTFSWKGLSLSVFFQYQRGARKYYSDKTVLIGQAADNNLMKDIYQKYWRQPGDVTWVPKPVLNGAYPGNPMKYDNNTDPGMSLILEKTDFIKLKNINLSYDFPQRTTQKLGLSSLQLYATAYNIWTTTPYSGYDPESTGNDRGVYPQSKSYSLGIKIDF